MTFTQIYDPCNNPWLSALIASLPLVLLLGGMLLFKLKAPLAAALGLTTGLILAVANYHMPVELAGLSALYGAAYGLLPIGWIIINILFLFRLVEEKGLFKLLQASLTRITPDQRLQLILVTIGLGSFFEGASGFGTPVAITTIILIGLGFPKLQATVLSLIANSTPVVYGSIGTAMIALQGVTNLDMSSLSANAAIQLIPLNLILPVWLVWTFAGFKRMLAVWPAILVSGLCYTVSMSAMATWHGPWLPTITAAFVTLASLLGLFRFWKPRDVFQSLPERAPLPLTSLTTRKDNLRAWLPWIILVLMVFVWSLPLVKNLLESATLELAVTGLNGSVFRTPPISTTIQPISAVFTLNWLSTAGTAVLFAALLGGVLMGHKPAGMLRAYAATLHQVSSSLVTICLLVALGFLTRYSGLDATLGLAFAQTGAAYPFFGAMLGWLGVLSTGSITASNTLFGNLQQISASQIGINPAFMAAANASGGVAGKLISPQSITITATAAGLNDCEPLILRKSLPHSLAMVTLMGLVILLLAYT